MTGAVILLAPGVVAPFTEGRKKFVVDLSTRLGTDIVDVVDGAAGRGTPPWRMLLNALSRLEKEVRQARFVLVFPFGTFSGLRGIANSWFVRRARRICARANIPVVTIVYSCAGLPLAKLAKLAAPGMAVGRRSSELDFLHLGLGSRPARWKRRSAGLTNLLFLCGYQQPTQTAFSDVMFDRGLADLLDAAERAAAANITLAVAIPFLRAESMRNRLLEEIRARCPSVQLQMLPEVDPLATLLDYDAFVFPYRTPHAVFVPTSLLEALSMGIPVIAADHDMYRSLTVGSAGPRCWLHTPGNAASLADAIFRMSDSYDEACARAEKVATDISTEWTIDVAAAEILKKIAQ